MATYSSTTLANTESMYRILKNEIQSSNTLTDLWPFIQSLVSIEQLQNLAIECLDQCHPELSNQCPKANTKIRKTFISTHTLNGITSDDVHANIISYLPSENYEDLLLISKHFRKIMLNHPFIFNDKGYKVHLTYGYGEEEAKLSVAHDSCS